MTLVQTLQVFSPYYFQHPPPPQPLTCNGSKRLFFSLLIFVFALFLLRSWMASEKVSRYSRWPWWRSCSRHPGKWSFVWPRTLTGLFLSSSESALGLNVSAPLADDNMTLLVSDKGHMRLTCRIPAAFHGIRHVCFTDWFVGTKLGVSESFSKIFSQLEIEFECTYLVTHNFQTMMHFLPKV